MKTAISPRSSPLGMFHEEEHLSKEIPYWWCKICPESGHMRCLWTTDKRQKATKVKCKCAEPITKLWIFVEYILLQKKHLSFAGACSQMNTTLYQNLPGETQNWTNFAFGTPWLPDLLYKHWFMSSVWYFCCWVADVPPHQISPAVRSGEKWLFPQTMVYAFFLT